jgi:hypothetical protein
LAFFSGNSKKNRNKTAKSPIDELNVEGLEPIHIDAKDVK